MSLSAAANFSSSEEQLHLPKIVHPSTRIADPNSINVTARGCSRASTLSDLADKYNNNELNTSRKPHQTSDNSFSRRTNSKINNDLNDSNLLSNSFNIPDGVKAVYTPDLNKVSMPVFGSRPGSVASVASRNQSATPAQQKVDIDEYHNLLKEKVKSNFHETKMKFRHADPEGKGGVSKEALAHIIASILGPSKPLSPQHYLKLTEKLGLKNRSFIKYEEFLSSIDNKLELPDWVDPLSSNSNNSFNVPVTRKATQVFVIIKEKSRLKTNDMINLIPQLNGGEPNKIFKIELLNTINSMAIKMEPEEFDKLWKKFDPENIGYVTSELFLKRLGLMNNSNSPNDSNNSFQESSSIPSANVSEMKSLPKYDSKPKSKSVKKNPIEKWLKKQFREGFSKMKSSFEELDIQKTGQVRRDQFLNVLRQHGFKIEGSLLDTFLQRCDVHVTKNSSLIPYLSFLEKFQNRSDDGLAYKIITNGENDDDDLSTIGRVERRLIKLFQNDFLGLLQTFRKIDRNKTNSISKQEFRAAIESHFSIEISDQEYEDFLRDVPRDSSSKIQYLEFMTRFDSDSSASLFDSQSLYNEEFQPKVVKRYEPIVEEYEEANSPRDSKAMRNIKILKELAKDQIKNHYKDVEKAWSEVDLLNSNEMSKDMMWNLFRKLKIAPPITRDEIDILWNEFILKDNKKLEYWQFVRHFGYSKKSAAFENAKRAPPKKGDNDMMLTSNKLGRDSILIRGSVQAKLILQFDALKRSFQEIDPYFTNYLLRDEFEEILRELCPELNKQEMEYICSKHENKTDGRINYMEFLAPYAPRRIREKPSDNVKGAEDKPSSRIDMNDTLLLQLRMKLSDNYKELRRIFKKHDFKQTGHVSISSFRESLKAANVNLSEEDMYSLLRRLDKDVSGTINYNKFINEIIKP